MYKICFVTEVTYPNYVNRIKKSSLESFFLKGLDKNGIKYYISTNLPNNFKEYENIDSVKVFDVEELRKNHLLSQEYELLPENPVGLYPSKYPWNLRRFIIEKAAQDGFNYIIYIDADNVIHTNISTEDILKNFKDNFEPNTVQTNSAVFHFENKSPDDVFCHHSKYIEKFKLNFLPNQYDTLDGPVQVFIGETNDDILRFTNNWHKFAEFGYVSEYGYKNNKHGNLSFVIPISGFKLKWKNFPFYQNHIPEDRYTHSYVHVKEEIKEEIKEQIELKPNLIEFNTEKKLKSLLEQYYCEKKEYGFDKFFEKYLESISESNSKILEIGVGTISTTPVEGMNHVPANMSFWKERYENYKPGNFLRALRDFLKTGELYGVDIQNDCVINEERIHTSIFDSRDYGQVEKFISDKKFDLIIDDGDHDVNIRIITFNNFINSLKEDGYYVIQGPIDLNFLKRYFDGRNIPYILVGEFMILNFNGNFDIFENVNTSNINNNQEINTNDYLIQEIIDYDGVIKETPKFSIFDHEFAEKGFYINLAKSLERKGNVEKQIEKYDIKGLIRFGALKDEMIQYSCTKSHLKVFEIASQNNLNTIFVAEDDFQIEEFLYSPYSEPISFKDKIEKINKDLGKVEWDVFLFGCNPKTHMIPVTENLAVVSKSTGAWAYLIKKSAYEYLLNNLNYKRDYIAIDDYLPILNDKGFVTLTSIPMTIGHAVGFVSTLQPNGPVNYTDWIRGSYHKFLFENYKKSNYDENKLEKDLTICIPGHFSENYIFYLRYALKSLPQELKKCKFLIRFDYPTKNPDLTEFIKLQAYFRDVRNDLNVTLTYGFGGLISSLEYFIENIKTDYFLFFEFDHVFLKKDKIDFYKTISSFKKYNFINSIYFSGDDVNMRGFDIAKDLHNKTTPFEKEIRVTELNLTTTIRWCNKPAIHRLTKMKEWFYKFIKNEHVGSVHQNQYNIEETMIPIVRNIISENSWDDIKDDWGMYLYGEIGNEPLIGHTDASRRYQGDIKSTLEINADKFILENQLNEQD